MKRFWEKVDASSECWEWLAAKTKHGYGNFCITERGAKKWVPAHRMAYLMVMGTIPDGLVLDHLCRNKGCVNPWHLEPVTNRENLRRGKHATKAECSNGHPRTSENTYVKPNGTTCCRVCKREQARARRLVAR